jgi:hypothetical protein
MIAPTSPQDESVVELTLRTALAGIGFGTLRSGRNGSGLLPLRDPRRPAGPGLRRGHLPASQQHDVVAIALLVAAKRSWPDSGWSQWLDAAHFAGKDFAWIPGAAGMVVGIGLVCWLWRGCCGGRGEWGEK